MHGPHGDEVPSIHHLDLKLRSRAPSLARPMLDQGFLSFRSCREAPAKTSRSGLSLRRQSVAVQAGPTKPIQQQPLDPSGKLSSLSLARVVMAGALEIGANGGFRQSHRRPMRGDR